VVRTIKMSLLEDSSNFKVEDESKNKLAQDVPDCIKALRPGNPDRDPLTEKQLGKAKMALWNARFTELEFPRTRKFRVDPPIPGQEFGIVSFAPSPWATPDRNGCFGVVKIRGNFSSLREAERYATMLMKKHDSYLEYDIVGVGKEFPIMVDTTVYTQETREVNIKAMVDDISLSVLRQKKAENKRELEEVEQRHRSLVSKTSKDEAVEQGIEKDLEYYTQLRTKKAHCMWVIDESKKKIQEAEEALAKDIKELDELDAEFPEYKTQYIQQYENGLRAVGTDVEKNPLIKYMRADQETEEKKE
jgi:hypothetical protein